MTIPVLSISRRTLLIIIGTIVVALAIPVTVVLVKQRQELRKEAEVGEDVVEDSCGYVTLGPPSESYDANTSTYTLTVPITNTTSGPLNQIKILWETYYCQGKDVAICDTIKNRQVSEEEINLSAGETKLLQKSVVQGLGDNCGSLQIDMVLTSIGGDDNCDTEGNWADLMWGLHRTAADCEEGDSPPGEPPACSELDGPSSTAPGDLVNLTAYPSGENLDSVEFWLISKEDVDAHGLCPSAEWAPKVWTLISKDLDRGDGWSTVWNTTGYPEGRYFVAANVYSAYGEDSWWCTGNPEGPCNEDPKSVSCSNCSLWITLETVEEVAKTPTPPPAPTPAPAPTPPVTKVPDTAITDPTLVTLFLGITLTLLGIHVIL